MIVWIGALSIAWIIDWHLDGDSLIEKIARAAAWSAAVVIGVMS